MPKIAPIRSNGMNSRECKKAFGSKVTLLIGQINSPPTVHEHGRGSNL